jgi:hypothetical protein
VICVTGNIKYLVSVIAIPMKQYIGILLPVSSFVYIKKLGVCWSVGADSAA